MGPITPEDLRFNRFGLSQQESRVLALAMAGRIDKHIAEDMGISLGTVRVYWKRIRTKVGGTRSEVIAELARNSLKLDYDGIKDASEALSRQIEALTARVHEFELYETLFTSYPEPIALLDAPTGKILRANRAFAELHGYPVDDLIKESSRSLMAAEEIADFDKAARAAAEKGTRLQTHSTRVRKDGTTLSVPTQMTRSDGAWVLALEADISFALTPASRP